MLMLHSSLYIPLLPVHVRSIHIVLSKHTAHSVSQEADIGAVVSPAADRPVSAGTTAIALAASGSSRASLVSVADHRYCHWYTSQEMAAARRSHAVAWRAAAWGRPSRRPRWDHHVVDMVWRDAVGRWDLGRL